MSKFSGNNNRIIKCVLLFFCIVLLSGLSGISANPNPKISPPNTSRDGHEAWVRTHGYNLLSSHGTGIWGDNEYVYTCGYRFPSQDLIVMKWDGSGSKIWEYILDISNSTAAIDIWGDREHLYVAGVTDNGIDPHHYFLRKLDKDGNDVWSKSLGPVPYSSINFLLIQGDDSGIYTCSQNDTEITLMKVNKDGTMLWNTTWIDNTSYSEYKLIVDTSNLYFCGSGINSDTHNFEVVLTKWEKDGTKIWNRTIMEGYNPHISLFASEIEDDFIYLGGDTQIGLKTIGYIGKMNKEAVIVWNRSIEITNSNFTYPTVMCCNKKEIFVCGHTNLDGEYSFFLGRWDKNGELNSIYYESSESIYYQTDLAESYVNDKDLYFCGTAYSDLGVRSLMVAKWDVSKNYFVRIGIPVIAIGLSVIVSWVIIKPVYRINKKRVQRKLTQIAEDLKIGNDYDESYSRLENMLNEVDRVKDRDMENKWHELHNIAEVNRDFKKELMILKNQIQEGNLDSAHSGLMYLLKNSHETKYEGILDKRLESEIMETLKQVSEEIKIKGD